MIAFKDRVIHKWRDQLGRSEQCISVRERDYMFVALVAYIPCIGIATILGRIFLIFSEHSGKNAIPESNRKPFFT